MAAKTTLAVDTELKNRLKMYAAENNINLAEFTNALLQRVLEDTETIKTVLEEVKSGLGRN